MNIDKFTTLANRKDVNELVFCIKMYKNQLDELICFLDGFNGELSAEDLESVISFCYGLFDKISEEIGKIEIVKTIKSLERYKTLFDLLMAGSAFCSRGHNSSKGVFTRICGIYELIFILSAKSGISIEDCCQTVRLKILDDMKAGCSLEYGDWLDVLCSVQNMLLKYIEKYSKGSAAFIRIKGQECRTVNKFYDEILSCPISNTANKKIFSNFLQLLSTYMIYKNKEGILSTGNYCKLIAQAGASFGVNELDPYDDNFGKFEYWNEAFIDYEKFLVIDGFDPSDDLDLKSLNKFSV